MLTLPRIQVLGIRKYHQLHTVAYGEGIAAVRGSQGQEYDGTAELWFDSFEFLDSNGKRPEAQAAGLALLEDEKNFIDLPNSPIFWVHENKVVEWVSFWVLGIAMSLSDGD